MDKLLPALLLAALIALPAQAVRAQTAPAAKSAAAAKPGTRRPARPPSVAPAGLPPAGEPLFNSALPPAIQEGPRTRVSYYDGNALLDLCQQHSDVCVVYMQAVNDALFTASFGTSRDVPYCIPSGAKATQIRDIVVQYLNAHPERRQILASTLTIEALSQAWPQCQ
jgi:hypothetical protein